MCALKSEGGFFDFLKSDCKGIRRAVIIFFIGIAVILLGGYMGNIQEKSNEPTEQLRDMCASVDGAGSTRVMVTYGEDGEVCGVAVLCEGADDAQVRAGVTKMICSLYGIGANRVSVLKIDK